MTNKTYFAFETKNFTSTSCCSKGDNGLICEVVDDDVKGESCIPLFLFKVKLIKVNVRLVRTKYLFPENYVGLEDFRSENEHWTPKNVRQKLYASVYSKTQISNGN